MIYLHKSIPSGGGVIACLVCGNRTSSGASLCSRCFKRVEDPFLTLGLAIDPLADQRFIMKNSVGLRIGPSFGGEVRLGKGLDPSLTFDRMIKSEDRSHIPSFVNKYLSDMGVDLELTGNEMVPSRKFLADVIKATEELEFDGDTWAKACLRMGNVVSLAIRNVAVLPLEPSDSYRSVEDLRVQAAGLYGRAKKFPELQGIAQKNTELMERWARPEGSP